MPKKSKYYFDGRYYCKRYKKGLTAREGYGVLRAKTEEALDVKVKKLGLAIKRGVRLDDQTVVAAQCAAWYERNRPLLSASEQSYFRPMINNVICPAIGAIRMQDVTKVELEDIVTSVSERSQSYQAKLVRLIKRIFADAAKRSLTIDDVSVGIKPGGKKQKQKDALTPEQIKAVFDAIDGTRAELFCALGYYAGLRTEEICGLRWIDVKMNGEHPSLTVNNAVTWPKKKKGVFPSPLKSAAAHRTIPIHPELLRRLKTEKRRSKSPFVIAGQNKEPATFMSNKSRWVLLERRMTYAALGETPPKIRKGKPGPKGCARTIPVYFTPHQLRHTFATNLIASGMDIKKVQYLMGHEDPAMLLRIYASMKGNTPADLSDAVTAAL